MKTQDFFEDFELRNPRPASVVPDIPQDAKAQLGTVDKLAQSVVPRIVDKLNEANWKIRRLEAFVDALLVEFNEMDSDTTARLNGLTQIFTELDGRVEKLKDGGAKKPARSRRKKEPELDMTEIADYDPDTDTWGPMEIDGHKITGALIETVEHLNGAANAMYSGELVQFIGNLEPHVKKAIAEKFPTL